MAAERKPSKIVALAKAVAAELNGDATTFSMEFQAERKYQPYEDLRDYAEVKVIVIPRSDTEVPGAGSRRAPLRDIVIDVGVQKKIKPQTEVQEYDELFGLVEEIKDFFRVKRSDIFPDAVAYMIANDPIFAPQLTDEMNLFTSIISINFRMYEP
jgi:hypothetical protein